MALTLPLMMLLGSIGLSTFQIATYVNGEKVLGALAQLPLNNVVILVLALIFELTPL